MLNKGRSAVQRGWGFMVLVVFLGLLGQFATELYLPSMPAMAQSLHVPINMIQLTITIYVLGFSFGSLLYGTLSDKFGRKPIIFICLLIGLAGSLVCCLRFNVNWLFAGRFIQGIGFSGVAVVSRSITKDVSPDPVSLAKLASIFGVLNSIAIAFAPVIGGYIQKYSFWRVNFILLLVFTVLAVFLCWYKMPETNLNKRMLTLKVAFADYLDVLSNKQFLLYNAMSALTLAGVVSYQTISPLLLQVKVGMAPDSFGYTAVVVTAALVLGSLANSRIMPRQGTEKMIAFGCRLYIVAGLIFVVCGAFNWINMYLVLVPMVLYMIGAGLVYPNCSSGAMSIFSTKAGTAASVYNFFQMLGATIGSGLVSTHEHGSQLLLGVMLAVIGLIGISCCRSLHTKTHKQIASI